MKKVKALNWKGTTLSVFGIMPKFKVICGECCLLFKARIHSMGDIYLKCPHCGTVNDLEIEVESND